MRRKARREIAYVNNGISDHVLLSVSPQNNSKKAGVDATNLVGWVRRGGLGLGGGFGLLGRHDEFWVGFYKFAGVGKLF